MHRNAIAHSGAGSLLLLRRLRVDLFDDLYPIIAGMPTRSKTGRASQEVRIIGGIHKGRKLRFRGSAELRPTMGRTRETLFNWLRPHIDGARCLDLFAGSGVLGFEALSQGAASVTFVEKDRRAHAALLDNIGLLAEPGSEGRAAYTTYLGDARRYLVANPPTTQPASDARNADAGLSGVSADKAGEMAHPSQANPSFDVIFIDPPFRHTDLLQEVIILIAQGGWASRFVYIEARNTEQVAETCGDYGLVVARTTRTGDASSLLLERSDTVAAPAAN